MPQPPDFAGIAATWRRDTNLTLATGRSQELQNVDLYLTNYQANKRPDNLELLSDALNAWLGGKTPTGRRPLGTRRDHSGAVTRLKHAVDNAVRLQPPGLWDARFPGIYIAHDLYRGNAWVPDDFVGSVREGLERIMSRPVGRGLIQEISRGCGGRKRVVIEYTSVFTMAAPLDDVSDASRKALQPAFMGGDKLDVNALAGNPALLAVQQGPVYVRGGGTSAVVCYNHADRGPPRARRPAFIGLAHELVHAYHYVLGACYRSPCGGIMSGRNTGLMEEEMRTTGVGPYRDETPSENAIRVEHDLPRRDSYDSDKDWSAVTASGPSTRLRRDRTDLQGVAPHRGRTRSF